MRFRLCAELLIEAEDSGHAWDRLKDALLEINGTLDCPLWIQHDDNNGPVDEIPIGWRSLAPMPKHKPNAPALWHNVRELSPEVFDAGEG